MHHLRRTIRNILLGALAPYAWSVHAGPPSGQLPVPCLPGTCGANAGFVTSGTASAVVAGKNLTVNQTTNSATLNWSSFNIAADGKVTFVQPTSSAVALNRIYDANPSQIFGSLTANGQIYLINANGFLFGATANINVAGLIASSLNLTDNTFVNGILSPVANDLPALEPFTGSYTHFSDSGPTGAKTLANTGTITIAPGAQLTAADGGRLLLAAGRVDNAGTLAAPDGQVILAAGQKVFLQASQDNSLRGLIVEVDAGSPTANLLSSVVNESTGVISTPRGNVTLAGLMVNQDGRISATTSVAANGSVTLTAGTAPVVNGGGAPIAAGQGGQITIGPDSDIEILPELTDTATAVALQTQLPSTVTISGQKIYMEGGTINAPNGTLNVTASSDPASGVASGDDPSASLRIASGTNINLAGSNATLPMDANLIQVQLRSNEFADDPTQRNGALEGDTVTIDIRADGGQGSPIADLASAIAAVGENIAQRTEAGGKANLRSGGDIVFAPGATINVSGGATTYQAGDIQTTKLIGANGKIYDIGSASPLMTYTGVINPTLTQSYNNWGIKQVVPTPGLSSYQPGYVQGAAAGSVQFVAPSLVLQGNLAATAVTGPYQRTASGSGMLGGTLIIGAPGNSANGSQFDYLAPSIEVVAAASPVIVSNSATLPELPLQLPATYLTGDGFSHIQLESNTSFLLPQGEPLLLPPGTTLMVQAARIDIDSSITSLGGSLILQSEPTVDEANYATLASPGAPRLGVDIGDGVTLDVSGQWTNDSFAAGGIGSAPTLQNGGTIDLALTTFPGELVLGNGVTLRANGGAWQQNRGTLTYGQGGSITLDASPEPGGAIQIGANTSITAFGVGTASGGSLTVDAPRIDLSPGVGTAWTEAQSVDDLTSPGGVLQLYAPLLSDDGFSNITLTATGPAYSNIITNTLTVEASTAATGPYLLQTRSLQLDGSAVLQATGGSVLDLSQPILLPAYERSVTTLALNALRLADDQGLNAVNYGSVNVKPGAAIVADPGASISITGAGDIDFGGSIVAPSGTVALKVLAPADFGFTGDLILDPGYIAGLGITLGPQSNIDVSATGPLYTPNNQGLLLGRVGSGGTVAINADRGSVTVNAGAQISFAGTSALVDERNPNSGAYTRETVGTAGGSLTIGAADSLELLGTLRGAGGTGSDGVAAGGALELDLVVPEGGSVAGQPVPASDPRVLDIVANAAGAPPPASEQATIGLAQILNGTGIDALTLNVGGNAPGEILFSTGQPLNLGRSLNLEAQNITVASGVTANVSAPDVSIGSPILQSTPGASQPPAVSGTGTLSVDSQLLTLVGNITVEGTQQLTLSSAGDIQLQGTAPISASGPEQGSLTIAGNVTLLAQRVYPDTFTDFSIEAAGGFGPSSVRIDPAGIAGLNSAATTAPLSAGGSLSVTADQIEVGGSLFAPFGQITLTANQSLQLSGGSLVSVSAAGLNVPYGQTQEGGAQWVYSDPTPSSSGLSGAVSTVAGGGTATTVAGTPTKLVSLTAPNLSVQSNATVDLAGGGDLYAYEWVPGTGGSADRLAGSGNSGNIPGLYAILPSQPGVPAPHDPQESGSFSSAQTVYLSGGAGITAGFYALLPPRYGLLPGAQLIQTQPSYTSPVGGLIGALGNGTPVVAGFLGSYGSTASAGSTLFEGFAIYPSGYAQQLAAYSISHASTYFSAAAAQSGTGPVPLPADAGTLNLTVAASTTAAIATSLDLQGKVETAAASGGRGAQINVSAPDLELSADGTATAPGALGVSSTVLQSWNASAITLGGTTLTDGNTATVAADDVLVDRGVSLSADQIYLMAHDDIDVQAGASLASTSGSSAKLLASAPSSQTLTLSDPNAAFLAVSDLALPLVSRTGAAGAGTLALDAGSTISSGGAIVLDAPGSVLAAGTIRGTGAAWALGSASIAFVGSTGAHPDTLDIDASLLQSLQAAGSLRLASQSSIDLLVPVTLGVSSTGSPTLGALTLLGNSIDTQSGVSASFGGASLSLGGASATARTPLVGSGTLTLVGNALNLEPNTVAISGFANTVLQIAGPLTSSAGSLGGIDTAGDLTVYAAEVTPGIAAQTSLTAGGTLHLVTPTSAAGAAAAPLVGGALALRASSIDDEGVIAAPAGVVTLTATSGDLHLGAGSTIDVAGILLQAADQSAPAPGGTIALSASGNVTLDAGSTLNVSGEQVAPAGRVDIVAGNTATLSGAVIGQAGSGGTGGDFSLNAGQLSGGFTTLASSLTSGGFSNAVDVHVQQGDLALLSGSTLTANSITLTADTGAVDIAGTLSAPSAALRGLIDLSGHSVLLDSGAVLNANGTAANPLGGEIEMNATCADCFITLKQGSAMTTSGAGGMGQVVLSAAALPGNDVAINEGSTGLGADLTHAGQLIINAVTTYTATTSMADPTAGVTGQSLVDNLSNEVGTASTFLSAAAGPSGVITQRLVTPSAQLGPTAPLVEAGLQIDDPYAADTLTLGNLDLSGYSTGVNTGTDQVINVGVRTAGAVNVSGTISDGFIYDPSGNTSLTALSYTPSASFNVVAGADVNSANPLATLRGSTANLTLLSSPTPNDDMPDNTGPAVIRTGTGDINLAAAGNIIFETVPANAPNATAYTASVYTGGDAPPNVAPLENGLQVQGPYPYYNTNILMNFGAGGGNVQLAAGNNILGAPVGVSDPKVDGGNYGVTGWLFRQGNANKPAQFGVDYGAFDWNVGSLGGGDVRVSAAGGITNLSAAVSDSYVAAENTLNNQATLYGAGGGLDMHAGGNIGSPQIYVADGTGVLTADGALSATRTYQPIGSKPIPVGATIALGDSQVSVWVRNGLQVEAIYDPTLVPQLVSDSDLQSNGFLTYGSDSSVTLSTTAGTALLELSARPQNTPLSALVGSYASTSNFSDMAPTLNLQALQGDIDVTGTTNAVLAPAAQGQLTLFAGQDISFAGNTTIEMADNLLTTLPTITNPGLSLALVPFSGVIHAQDPDPALITAGRDIVGLSLVVPKATQIVAGRDIVNLQFQGQNISSDDVTLIAAGRDYRDSSANGSGVVVGGPGSVDLLAGRNLDFGFNPGVVTVGSLINANLPTATGADINLMVGYGSQGADLSGFVDTIIVPSPAYQGQLIAYVESLNGASGLSFAQARADFATFTPEQQSALTDAVFFNELLLSGRAANSGSGVGFAEGYAAIDALFPDSRPSTSGAASPYAGGLTLSSSQIYTDAGGNISILVPGGGIDVGLANSPPGLPTKPASQLGIVAEGSGNIDIYALNDVNVNTSRIFTLGGGNILIWSTLGSIDAGNGSKSSLSVPPPTISINKSGQVSLNFGSSLAAGSGIRTIQTDPNAPPGNVDLDAPVGTVNAGDAGIGASGNINIAAAHVVGVDNINFGGTATGVPSDVSSLGASLAGASSAAAGTTSSSTGAAQESAAAAKQTAPIAEAALNWLDVFVTGLGEENCKPDDVECLKRQKSAAP
ncbi:MAG TPA: filamentous hemagglutinin family protein [Steroidobacteraceae bacterium]|nr:filamentous hemagglutinin family protein [Steroidobacteraceae bacterium]